MIMILDSNKEFGYNKNLCVLQYVYLYLCSVRNCLCFCVLKSSFNGLGLNRLKYKQTGIFFKIPIPIPGKYSYLYSVFSLNMG